MYIIKFILSLLYYLIEFFCLSYTLYYIITGIVVFFKKNIKFNESKPKTKFAVLIPARNESMVISNLIDSLKRQSYPKELFDIFVVPNNCTDDTKDVSLKRGAKIIEIKEDIKTKGDALKHTFKVLSDEYLEYDAYCVFDADNIVHPNFLQKMNDAYVSGVKVAQGYRDSKNPSDTWISSCYSLFYLIQNYFFNQARSIMSLSSSINGTGFMVASSVIKEYGFDTFTMTEDIEFAAKCALNNIKIGFVKEAITYDEQPLKFLVSCKQRKRWSVGTLQCLKYYSPKLFRKSIKEDDMVSLDMSLFYMAPIFQSASFFILILPLFYNFIGIELGFIFKLFGKNQIPLLFFGYIMGVVLSVFVTIVERKKIKNMFKGAINLFFFMITWIPINITCFNKTKTKWEPIEHKRIISIDKLVNDIDVE